MHLICQRCKKAKATVHVTDSFPQKREWHLCEDCAAEEGIIHKISEKEGLSALQHQTTNAILQEFLKHKAAGGKLDNISCPRCGLTFGEFQVKGLLGCPHDYTAFSELLTPLLQRAHEGATHHVGKVPPQTDSMTRNRMSLIRLRRELQEAIERENYELAARVRDQIRDLETV